MSTLCCVECQIQGINTSCTRNVGVCGEKGRCDENANCQPQFKSTDDPCREPFEEDSCDLGDNCDGTTDVCPRTGVGAGCTASVQRAGKHQATVECQARLDDRFGRDAADCDADGVSDADADVLAVGAEDALPRLADVIHKKIRFPRNAQFGDRGRSKRFKLKLNQLGRALLARNRTLLLRVRVTVRNGAGHQATIVRVMLRK